MHKIAVSSSNGQPPDGGDDVLNARRWQRILGSYSTPSRLRSIAELAITALPLVMLWTAAWFTFSLGHAWASLLIAIPAAGFLVRLFMIQHDCGHGTFFAGRLANDWVGRVIGVLTLTPYDCWRRSMQFIMPPPETSIAAASAISIRSPCANTGPFPGGVV